MATRNSTQTTAIPVIGRFREWSAATEKIMLSPRAEHWTNSLTLWMALNALDSMTTWQALSLGGYEANPTLGLAAATYGDVPMLAGKMALALLIGILVWMRGPRRVKGLLNLGMTLVIITNCLLLLRPMWLVNL